MHKPDVHNLENTSYSKVQHYGEVHTIHTIILHQPILPWLKKNKIENKNKNFKSLQLTNSLIWHIPRVS